MSCDSNNHVTITNSFVNYFLPLWWSYLLLSYFRCTFQSLELLFAFTMCIPKIIYAVE